MFNEPERNPKDIKHGTDIRHRLVRGAKALTKVTSLTYGPHGRTVLMQRFAGLLASKDGVTVAREVSVSDPMEQMGCKILQDACVQVNDDVGDGTTSTAVIAAELLDQGTRLIVAGLDPMEINRGISRAARDAVLSIEELTEPVTDQGVLERVAMIASNGDKVVSEKMAEACMAVGQDGTITIEDGNGIGIDLVFQDGMEIPRGAIHPGFLGSGSERLLEQPLVAVINYHLHTYEDVQDLMEVASQWPNNPLLVFALNVEGDALQLMYINDVKDVMKVVPIASPGFHHRKLDNLKDIAALSGATVVDEAVGLNHRSWDPEWFGTLRKVTVEDRKTSLVAFDDLTTEQIDKRVEEIKHEMTSSKSEYDQDRCRERIAKLSGGLCLMQVGGITESVMKERRARIEDALSSVQAALEQGVVPGAGMAYLYGAHVLQAQIEEGLEERSHDFKAGYEMMAKALKKPLETLARNADHGNGVAKVHEVWEATKDDDPWVGWDALQDRIRDLSEDPIILDPIAVVRAVILTSASAAGTLLTAEVGMTRLGR